MMLLPKIRSKKIMQAPKLIPEMGCQLRIASFVGLHCSGHDTRVMAHNPFAPDKGQATKGCDTGTMCACLLCHDLLDLRDMRGIVLRDRYPLAFMTQVIRAQSTTRAFLIGAGIITVPDGEIV